MKRLVIELSSDLHLAKEVLSTTELFFYKTKHCLIKEPIMADVSMDYDMFDMNKVFKKLFGGFNLGV